MHSVESRRCTVTVYITSGVMASGDAGGSRPRADRNGVSFCYDLQTSWNAPESYVTLDSPEVVELDTSVVPNLLGLRACYPNAKPTWCCPEGPQTVSVC